MLPPSSLRVNRPIWGKSLKVSRQMTPAARSLAMHTWSCLTNRGRVLLFSPVFLSTRQIKACRWDLQRFQLQIQRVQSVAVAATYNSYNKKKGEIYRWATHCDLHLLDAGVDVEDCVVTRTNDWFVLDDDDLRWQRRNFAAWKKKKKQLLWLT